MVLFDLTLHDENNYAFKHFYLQKNYFDLQHPTGVPKIIGSIPVGGSGFFFDPC